MKKLVYILVAIGIVFLVREVLKKSSDSAPNQPKEEKKLEDTEEYEKMPPNDVEYSFQVPEKYLSTGGHFYIDQPKGTPASNKIISYTYFSLSNNKETKFADWVAYKITKESQGGEKEPRNWAKDPNLDPSETIEPKDYKGAYQELGYDRGHQAPLGAVDGNGKGYEANYLSNITPQKSGLNQGPWRLIEEAERRLLKNSPEPDPKVYVLTGPLYERKMPELPHTKKKHTVPSAYWKIVILPVKPGVFHLAAFILDQNEDKNSFDLKKYMVSVNEIEKRSGLDFFSSLPDKLEEDIESRYFEAWIEKNFQADPRARKTIF